MPSAEQIAACDWLTDEELAVYSSEYSRTGFQGGLQSYRVGTRPELWRGAAAVRRPHDRRAGRRSSAARATGASTSAPGAWSGCRPTSCTEMRGVHLVEGAGHWVQQEQPEAVSALLVRFLAERLIRALVASTSLAATGGGKVRGQILGVVAVQRASRCLAAPRALPADCAPGAPDSRPGRGCSAM